MTRLPYADADRWPALGFAPATRTSGCRSSTDPRITGPRSLTGTNSRSVQAMISLMQPSAFSRSTAPSVKPITSTRRAPMRLARRAWSPAARWRVDDPSTTAPHASMVESAGAPSIPRLRQTASKAAGETRRPMTRPRRSAGGRPGRTRPAGASVRTDRRAQVFCGPAKPGRGRGLRFVFAADPAFVPVAIEGLEEEGVVDLSGARLLATGVVRDLDVHDPVLQAAVGRQQLSIHALLMVEVELEKRIRRAHVV